MLTKTDYIIWRDCAKNAWLKVHKPEIYKAQPLSAFELQIIEAGNEVDELARNLFPTGEYQKKFEIDGYLAITDILAGNNVYEVKATNDIDKKTHYHDLAFQTILLEMCGLEVESANLVHLNAEYVREGELDITQLFTVEDVTQKINEMKDEVREEMKLALDYINQEKEPAGYCSCVYKGRSGHCTTFKYSNPDIPEYSIHDLARIGVSKRKLIELVDGNKFNLHEVPEEMGLSDIQKNQIATYLRDLPIIERERIAEELDSLIFPLYFLDYETFPAAIPRFDQFSPYQQIPFQYSLHVLPHPSPSPTLGEGGSLMHFDFLHTENTDPSEKFAESLMGHIGEKGHVVVWHKSFECNRNKEIAERVPKAMNFMNDINKRVFDLEDIFKKQYYVHKDFKGSSSIKKVLPVLVPDLSYKELEIREGGSAADAWDKIVRREVLGEERDKLIDALREYCKLDTYAMYAIWRELHKLVT